MENQLADFKSGIKLSGGGSKIRNLDLLFKKHFADVPVDLMKINNIVYKENFEDKRIYYTFWLISLANIQCRRQILFFKNKRC